ncbi:MAG: maleylpyruvate isomerase family mycothiol-dependent enzyme [Acidobacteria bacterium]|nr:maleylpyruvate isomerase family mycothiol-dependent enzyme [Acidobacteriota bacterium]
MTELSSAALLANLKDAAGTVRNKVSSLTDAQLRENSVLPGWSRGHVVAHITGISNAMARQLEYARRGEKIEIYDGGYAGRTQAIEMAASQSPEQHLQELNSALDRALNEFSTLDDAGWATPISFRDGVVKDGGLALWRELVIHLSDLEVGRGPETWSREFCEHLFDFLSARVPEDTRLKLQPLGLPAITLGAGANTVSINGMLTDIAAWLAGREPSLGSLRAEAAADGVALPTLLPWPSGTATTTK